MLETYFSTYLLTYSTSAAYESHISIMNGISKKYILNIVMDLVRGVVWYV